MIGSPAKSPPTVTQTDLHTQILRAHDTGDQTALITLYTLAADQSEDVDAECFFLTYAYIFALELGHSATDELAARLKRYKRL